MICFTMLSYQVEISFPVAHLKEEQKLVLHVYYWDTIQETIDITMTSTGKYERLVILNDFTEDVIKMHNL